MCALPGTAIAVSLRLSRAAAWAMLAAIRRLTVSLVLVALASLTSAMPVVAQDHGTTESLDVEARALFAAGEHGVRRHALR